jgi:hypothetical protein
MWKLFLSVLLLAIPVAATADPRVDGPAVALGRDAAAYASAHGVIQAEALRRLRLQLTSIPVTEKLRLQFADRLAGISIEHSPEWRIIVLLTGKEAPNQLLLPAGDDKVPVLIRGGAAATRMQVLAAIDRYRSQIAQVIPGTRGIGHDPRTGKLLVFQRASAATRPAAEVAAELSTLTGVPVEVRRISASFENAGAVGGSRVISEGGGTRYICTTGFLVQRGEERGVTTAAHCSDNMSYRGPDGEERLLKFAGQWGTAYRDVQVHTGVGSDPPIIYTDTPRTIARPVTGWLTRPMTRAGDWVCKRGEASGASCAEVELTDFAPPGELCGGLCSASWVTVKGPQCRRGDSGAPVFIGTTALGVLKGGAFLAGEACAFYYYMSTDYLPDGWRLMVSAPAKAGA